MWPFRKKNKLQSRVDLKNYLFAGSPPSQLLLQPIKKESVLNRELHDLDNIIEDVKRELRECANFSYWNIKIQWDAEDQRDPYKIKEIQDWHQAAHDKFPYLPIFLSEMTLGPYLACLLKIESVKDRQVYIVDFEFLTKLLGLTALKGSAFFMMTGLDDIIDDKKILIIVNDFINRSLRSLRIDSAELKRYNGALREGIKRTMESYNTQIRKSRESYVKKKR